MDTIYALGNAIQGKPKKIFHLDKLGSTVVFAVDESRRLLTVYASSKVGFDLIPRMMVNSLLRIPRKSFHISTKKRATTLPLEAVQ